MENYILFDIGGTKTRVSVTHDLETYSEAIKYETPGDNFELGIQKIVEAAQSLCSGRVTAAAGGMRGPMNKNRDGIRFDHLLTDWIDKPITTALSEALQAPVHLENDAALVGLGEAVYGAGKASDIMAYYTVSTGVGGARIVNGVIDPATYNFEPGRQTIDFDNSANQEAANNTLGSYISGERLEKRFGKKPYEIPQDDPVWDELAGWFAQGLRNGVMHWSPDTIVMGGSMIVGDPRILLADIQRHLEAVLAPHNLAVPILLDATLADEGGLYGAMALLKQKLQ